MKVKLLNRIAGPAGTHDAGAVVDLPSEQAHALLTGGYATRVDVPIAEFPVASETTASKRKPEKRGKGKR